MYTNMLYTFQNRYAKVHGSFPTSQVLPKKKKKNHILEKGC